MTLPASGAISLYGINSELGRSPYTSTISLDSAENGSYAAINTTCNPYPSATNPASISEWYSYNHNATTIGRRSCDLQVCGGNPDYLCTDSMDTTCDDGIGVGLYEKDSGGSGLVYRGYGSVSYLCTPPSVIASTWTSKTSDFCCA